jgi:hypothetical protein
MIQANACFQTFDEAALTIQQMRRVIGCVQCGGKAALLRITDSYAAQRNAKAHDSCFRFCKRVYLRCQKA